MITRSASARICASEGAGSKVWELVPSGTIPRRSIRVPPTLRTIELIGATVVATFSLPLSPSDESVQPSDEDGAIGVASCAVAEARDSANPIGAASAPRKTRRRVKLAWQTERGVKTGLLHDDNTPSSDY